MFKIGRSTKLRIAATAILACTLGAVAAPAHASFFSNSYNVNMGTFQYPAYTAKDIKATTAANGRVSVTSVGSNYTVDALMCHTTLNCTNSTKVFGLDDGEWAWLKNSLPRLTEPRLQLRSGVPNIVQVQVIGWWYSG